MAYRPSKRRHHSITPDDVNLIPILNIFMIIIPFLLLTAVFARTSIVDIYLPKEGQDTSSEKSNQAAKILTVKVTEDGFELGGIGEGITIPKLNGGLNLKKLTSELARLKDKYPNEEDAVLLFKPDAPYDMVINIMDAARETTVLDGGKSVRRMLFPLVSLGENK